MATAAPRRSPAIFRTSIFVLLVMGTVGVYLPRYLGLLSGGLHTNWRLVGVLPFGAGACIALRCAFAFAWTGVGTPAPFDPPRRLVVTGFYRYVRNPMYFGVALFGVGEWLLWGSDPKGALAYAAVFAIAVTLFVIFYEEPALGRKFPDDYPAYSQNVPRFLPRLRPWDPHPSKSATHTESRPNAANR
jgi:protein-S-isoprenylcysteine O-methyltransferase Ste14